jgi:hypothetical protein
MSRDFQNNRVNHAIGRNPANFGRDGMLSKNNRNYLEKIFMQYPDASLLTYRTKADLETYIIQTIFITLKHSTNYTPIKNVKSLF